MSKISSMMDVGKRSMMNSQTALQTTGHNIANKATEGYSRQRVEVVTAEPIGEGGLRIGMGTRTAAVTRTNNPYLEKQISNEQSALGYHQGKSDPMNRVEQVYNEQINKGLNTSMADFFNSFRELANNPESLATKTQVTAQGEALAQNFKHVYEQLHEISRDIDAQLSTNVGDINEYSSQIARLNQKIMNVEATGGIANDERDSRDLFLKKLGEKINIRYAEGQNGMVTVTAGNSGLLVGGTEAKKLLAQSTPGNASGKLEGSVDIFHQNAERFTPIKLTDQFVGGTVGGLLEVRDKMIGTLTRDMDKMAYTLASTVNAVHERGYDAQGRPAGAFFEVPDDVHGASAQIAVSRHLANDAQRVATAGIAGAPGDNRVANALAQIQYTGLMGEGTSTVDEYYNSVVSRVGIETRKTNVAVESQKDTVKQLNNLRESLSGVSLDEETTKLIEYQKAFDASARLIKTADEMMDTVINLKR